MRIAVVGTGVAGSYLMNQLSDSRDHTVTGFERYSKKNYRCVCAWGTSKSHIEGFARDCDLDFDDYILHECDSIRVEAGGVEMELPSRGLVAFDKHRFFADMHKGRNIRYDSWVRSADELKDFDLVVDATGLRVLLPRIEEFEVKIPCVQFTIKYDDPPFDDFYVEVLDNMAGYLWYFPLGNKTAHVGAGDINHGHMQMLEAFLEEYGGEKSEFVGRPIRLCPPSHCLPFEYRNVVGVGESIGTVFPLLGEGIIPTLQSARLLKENLENLRAYKKKVLDKYSFYDTAYNFLMPFVRGEIRPFSQSMRTFSVLMHMWENENRYGFSVTAPRSIKIDPISLIGEALTLARMIVL